MIDFTDNEIKLMDNFPRMPRLTTLLFSNNYIFHIGRVDNLVNLTVLILNNNKIVNLNEIDKLVVLEKLEVLSLMDNPVATKLHYRLYCIYKLPWLKLLDFEKVKTSERESAKLLFNNTDGASLINHIATDGAETHHLLVAQTQQQIEVSSQMNGSSSHVAPSSTTSTLTDNQKRQIRMAIEAATTKEEMDTIERQLRVRSR